jgi:peptidyl-prolyl isomerase E (cyclophilin E)
LSPSCLSPNPLSPSLFPLLPSPLHPSYPPQDVNIPLDVQSDKHRGFGFVEYLDPEDAAAAIDNMHNAELYGKVLRVNFAKPVQIKGGEKGWSSQAVWADADTWLERQAQEEEIKKWSKAEAAAATGAGAAAAAGPTRNPMEELQEEAAEQQ